MINELYDDYCEQLNAHDGFRIEPHDTYVLQTTEILRQFARQCVVSALSEYPLSIFSLEQVVRDVRTKHGYNQPGSDLASVCEAIFELHDEGLVRMIRSGINRGKQELIGYIPTRQ